MFRFLFKNFGLYLSAFVLTFLCNPAFSQDDDIDFVIQEIKQDIKTLEKAVYNSNSISGESTSFNNEDVLTRHLLKLSEIEEQFREITNKVEEINFKIDKLSSRVSKMQADAQLRFQDLESSKLQTQGPTLSEPEQLPGTSLPTELGQIADSDLEKNQEQQKTLSVESAQSVITETTERAEKILPEKSIEERYKFAKSFVKVGDYDTAEFALREFIDSHPDHDLAGNAQYWYGETFRIRQLYQDAATAYLDGYQKYPNSTKAPVNLLKLGVTLVQIGEKEQGCSMILAISDQYPKADQSVIQKAEYEEKKFKCKQS